MKMKLLATTLMFACLPFFCDAQGKAKEHKAKSQKVKTQDAQRGKDQNAKATKVKTQNTTIYQQKARAPKAAKVKTIGPPPWAPAHGYRAKQHVYFPDYYTYYDPTRGYVYWNGSNWVTSTTVPTFLGSVNLGKARIQLLRDVDLTVRPEFNYNTYMRLYPAQRVEIVVPVPR